MKLPKIKNGLNFSKNKDIMVINIGDSGAILSYLSNGKIESRMFSATTSMEDSAHFMEILNNNPDIEVKILVDVMDQSYSQHTLPAVSKLSIGKLVQQRLKREFPESDLTGSICLGRNKEGRKDWNFTFISVPMIYPVLDWIEFLNKVPNRIEGIYLLPVETVNIMAKISKSIAKEKKSPIAEWKIFITHNKVGGFRQVVSQNDQVVFTRMVSGIQDTMPEILAGSIEQEVLNTMEYIRRLSYNDSSTLDIIICVSGDIKQSIDYSKFRSSSITIYTPYELSKVLGCSESSQKNDKFSDTLIASYFIKNKANIRITTPQINKLHHIHLIGKIYMGLALLSIPAFVIYAGIYLYNIYGINNEVSFQEEKLKKIRNIYEKENQDFREEYKDLTDKEMTKVANVATLYNLLVNKNISPFNIIADFSEVQTNRILVKDFKWGLVRENNYSPPKIKVTIKANIDNTNISFQTLFNEFDTFIERLEEKFKGYELSYSRLPSRINLNNASKEIPINITISGDINE